METVGKQNCYVSLPDWLLEAFLSEQELPSFPIVLELHVPAEKMQQEAQCGPWFVAWDGSVSRSTNIEVAKKLADCMGLPAGASVVVRGRSGVLKADSIAIEPASPDDWEMVELNAAFLEEQLMTQVGVLFEGQQFPVWIESGSVLLLKAVSTKPSKLVRLGPGAELVVAPKKRVVAAPSTSDTQVSVADCKADDLDMSKKTLLGAGHAWLRVQELDSAFAQPVKFERLVCSSLPTTAIFVCPLTVKVLGLEHGQLVVLFKFASVSSEETGGIDAAAGHAKSNPQVQGFKRRAIVKVCVTEAARRGHGMLAHPLQNYLGLDCHSCVGIQACNTSNAALPAVLELTPMVLREMKEVKHGDTSDAYPAKKPDLRAGGQLGKSVGRWSNHIELFSLAGAGQPSQTKTLKISDVPKESVRKLLQGWVEAQRAALFLAGCESENYVPVTEETIIHIRLNLQSVRNSQETGSLKSSSIRSCKDMFFLVCFPGCHEVDLPKTMGSAQLPTENRLKAYFLLDEKILAEGVKPPSKESPTSASGGDDFLSVQIGGFEMLSCQMRSDCCDLKEPDVALPIQLGNPVFEALLRLRLLLFPAIRKTQKNLEIAHPGGILLYGPPACGKTRMALMLAQELQSDTQVLAHRVFVSCNELVGEQAEAIQGVLDDALSEALDRSPALIILDDLDSLFPKDTDGSESAPAVMALAEYLCDLMDCYQGGEQEQAIAFLATARSPMALPDLFCFSGRYDYHVELPTPAALERVSILEQAVAARGFKFSKSTASKVAMDLDGANASDLDMLVDRAVHAAAARFLCPTSVVPTLAGVTDVKVVEDVLLSMRKQNFELSLLDFNIAKHSYVPAAMQGITTGGADGTSGWDDVGGLVETRQALQEILELPVKYDDIFAGSPLRMRSGVLLYGPPGCGKTHIVAAAAAACSLRFVSVKGPELLNKYIGASEQAVRDVFAKAAAAAPALLFFDEFDAIAPQRGHDNTGVTDRVVNQLLTELDGVEALNGIFVFAATSRPDLLDAALLRPGRLDRMLLCDFPSTSERSDILQVLSKKLPLAEDVDLDSVAGMTEGFSAADLQAVCSDAQLESVHSFLANKETMTSFDWDAKPVIAMDQLRRAALSARPSVPETERRRLNDIYASFMGSRRTTSTKTQEREGKRATLA